MGKIRKGIYLSVGLASLVKKEAEKHANSWIKQGKLKTQGARNVINKVATEARKEGKRIENLLVAELIKEAKKTKPYIRKVTIKAKKKIKAKAKKYSKK